MLEGAKVLSSQYDVQRLVDREATSSYYTSPDGLEVIRELARRHAARAEVVADPFMGSGLALTAISDLVRPRRVVGVELNEAPCRLAASALREAYPGSEVEVSCGDAFELGWRYGNQVDLVVTNPPFVRWQRLPAAYRRGLLEAFEARGYGSYIGRRDPGLHILGLMLIDFMLRDGGLLISVLPASTFYTDQGAGVKRLLRERYEVLAVVENGRSPSFSDGSGFRELIIAARKSGRSGGATELLRLEGGLARVGEADLRSLPGLVDRNWLSLFRPGALELARRLEEQVRAGRMRYLSRGEVVRGIEMYGPDFFFIPNRHWRVVREAEGEVVIRSPEEGDELAIPRRYLVPCLRRSGLYLDKIKVESPGFYVLAIDKIDNQDVQRYVEFGKKLGVPAMKVGERWYSFAYRQIVTKRPFGHVFIHDKFDLTRHRVIANYSPRPLCASKDFYVVKVDSPLLAAWFNSSLFRSLVEAVGREISHTWTRLVEEDYLRLPVPSARGDERALEDPDLAVSKVLGLDLDRT